MKIYCIGIGPGGEEQMTLRAVRALEACDCVAGYGLYLDLIDSLIEGKERIQTGMTREVDRCAAALERAKQGRTVAVVSSGDAGVYGMAGLLIELAAGTGGEVEVIPGITAACSGGAVLGSPLTCDFACISLSDLLTPWDKIEQRLRGAAAGDFCIALYNPSSRRRADHLARATFCSRACRPRPCAVRCAASAVRARAFRSRRSVRCATRRSICSRRSLSATAARSSSMAAW